MKKILIFKAAIISMALVAFTACDEVKTYEKFPSPTQKVRLQCKTI